MNIQKLGETPVTAVNERRAM